MFLDKEEDIIGYLTCELKKRCPCCTTEILLTKKCFVG